MSSDPSPTPSRPQSMRPNGINGRGPSSAAFDAMCKQPRQPLPRPAQPLTWVLANHSKAYLEAQQYASGFTFLHTLLTTGASISTPAKPYRALLAPAAQIALAATVVVWPTVTTKARSPDKIKGADAALRYLRGVQTTIYPTDDTLKSAFACGERSRRRAQKIIAINPSANGEGEEGEDGEDGERFEKAANRERAEMANNMERLMSLPATSQSLWNRAEDFWHIVGWAFNCSVAHKKRWERWKLWLELMLDFLEADWEARIRLAKEDGADIEQILMDSLIWHYITSEEQTSRTSRTRMVRAILAMATPASRKEFTEIWVGETLEPKPLKDNEDKPVTKVENEDDDLADLGSDDEDILMEDAQEDVPVQPAGRALSSKSSNSSMESVMFNSDDPGERLGGMDAIDLRQRFLALLSSVSLALPLEFTDPGSLYDSSFADIFLYLPTGVFSLLLSTTQLSEFEQLALNSNLLFPLVSAKVPNYAISAPIQSHFEDMIFPIRATVHTYERNAKVSLLLEQMFMDMMSSNSFQATDRLRKAVEAGIKARMTIKGKKGNAQEEEQAKSLMEASGERLLGLLEILEVAAGMQPQERKRRSTSLAQFSSFDTLSSPPSDLSSP